MFTDSHRLINNRDDSLSGLQICAYRTLKRLGIKIHN